jgi:D-glycero-alpha-D-manno-heptose-7-phosphate kinase
MIVSRTPFRLSFFGGGTDYPAWFRQHGGTVLSTTINKYCYLTVRYLPPFFEHRIRVVYSKIENCQTVDEIAHPAVRETLRFLEIERGIEVHHDGDLPAGSGMGSSSAFTVGLLHALHALQGRMPSKRQLAEQSIHIEQELIREAVGSQDQISAAYGGFNQISFLADGSFTVTPITVRRDRLTELNSSLMLFYTGIRRMSSDVASTYVNTFEEKKRQLRIARDLVDEGISILSGDRDLAAFGELLHEAWEAKRGLSPVVSNSDVDEMYTAARNAGAVGGKLTGAGGGGFLLLYVPIDRQEAVRRSLERLIHVPFRFEYSGSQIIFFDAEEDYADAEKARAGQTIGPFRDLKVKL